jgi:outer membrane protein assembly factor BamB
MVAIVLLEKYFLMRNLIVFSGEGPSVRTDLRLSRPLIGEDGRIYICSEKTLYAFESNGSIAWTSYLSYACNASMAPVHGTVGKVSSFPEF